jgi:hypothetical protein
MFLFSLGSSRKEAFLRNKLVRYVHVTNLDLLLLTLIDLPFLQEVSYLGSYTPTLTNILDASLSSMESMYHIRFFYFHPLGWKGPRELWNIPSIEKANC